MRVQLYGGPHDGATVTTDATHPQDPLRMPVRPGVDLRAWDIHLHPDPDVPVAVYRFIVEPRWNAGARFVYRYEP